MAALGESNPNPKTLDVFVTEPTVIQANNFGCERLDLHQRSPVSETGEIATSLLRNIIWSWE